MASIPSAAQKASRWGSFLSSVESRLDTILADEDPKGQNKQTAKVSEQPTQKDGAPVPPPRGPSPAGALSANRVQDRLNERLAKAMAAKNLTRRGDTSLLSSGVPSRTGSPANMTGSPRDSVELRRDEKVEDSADENRTSERLEQKSLNAVVTDDDKKKENLSAETEESPTEQLPILANGVYQGSTEERPSLESPESLSTRQSQENTRSTTPNIPESAKTNGFSTSAGQQLPEEYEKIIEQLHSDNEATELRRQEEMHEYIERIDTLQAKLQYLTREAAEIAKTASFEAKPGSLEQKLAAKDEKIALLIEEGQKLSQTELKHMTVIKKLRAKSLEDEKAVTEARRTSDKNERLTREAQDRTKRADAAERKAAEKIKSLQKLEKELEITRADRDDKNCLIQDLQFQLSEITSAAKEAEEKAQADALEAERRRATELADELFDVKTERDLAEKENQNALRELREKSEREKERARVAEVERQGEQSILESRLEAYRARAEEASAGQGGDVQAKLLRQIETLQNQYAVASENWQGIEGSLLSRVTILEKERDEIVKREADIRRKTRESVRHSFYIDRLHSQLMNLEHQMQANGRRA